MTNGKHTRASWGIEGKADGGFLISEGVNSYGDGPERYVGVIKADRTGELREADVRLIAAAPDLLEALRPLAECEIVQTDTPLKDSDSARYLIRMGEIRAARAAIAKATGAE